MLSLTLVAWAAAETPQGTTLFVSPAGKEGHPGTQQQPLATLEAARDAAPGRGWPQADRAAAGRLFSGPNVRAPRAGQRPDHRGRWARLRHALRRIAGCRLAARRPAVLVGRVARRQGGDVGLPGADGQRPAVPVRARWPAAGAFLHRSTFNVPWLSSVGGGWERKPTSAELTTMLYDPADVPATLEVKNAEVRVYHMWDESMVGVARNDSVRHALIFSPAAQAPAGAFGVKKYVIFNTREGMTQAGQWYLDRPAGRVVYWPLPGEDMSQARVIAPRLERLVRIAGSKSRPVEGITLRGLRLESATTPLKAGGFGAFAFDGALRIEWARHCALEKLEIGNVGGQGLLAWQLLDSHISQCHIHHTGACGLKVDGSATTIAAESRAPHRRLLSQCRGRRGRRTRGAGPAPVSQRDPRRPLQRHRAGRP